MILKAVPKVNLDGFYIEDTLVDATFSGVVPFYLEQEYGFLNNELDQENTRSTESEISGYIVGIPVIPGLFLPRFDIKAWDDYQDAIKKAEEAYREVYSDWSTKPEDKRGEPPKASNPIQPTLWKEGLSPEEIEELTKPIPQEPTELDRIGAELVARELEALELKHQNEALGAQIVGLELRLLSVENQGGTTNV